MLAPACKKPDVERAQRDVFERRRNVARGDALGETLDDRRLADAGFAGENGVVLPAPHEHVDDLPDLFVAADDGIDLALARALGEVDRESRKRLLLAERGGRHLARPIRPIAQTLPPNAADELAPRASPQSDGEIARSARRA